MASKKSRSLNLGQTGGPGAPQQEHDPKNRLGNFTGAGEHARQGGSAGIVGQTTKQFKTDKKKK
jgi:hypothetical protein